MAPEHIAMAFSPLRDDPATPGASGVAGKLVITAAVLATGAGLYSVTSILSQVVGRGAFGLMMMVVAAYWILTALMMWTVWRGGSRPGLAHSDAALASFRPAHGPAEDLGPD